MEFVQGCLVAGDEFAFGVGDGEVHLLDAAKEDAFFAENSEVNPAVFEFAAVVKRKGSDGLVGAVREQDSRFDENLHAVADADNELAGGFKVFEAFGIVSFFLCLFAFFVAIVL